MMVEGSEGRNMVLSVQRVCQKADLLHTGTQGMNGGDGIPVASVQKMPRSFQGGEVKAFHGLFRQNTARKVARISRR